MGEGNNQIHDLFLYLYMNKTIHFTAVIEKEDNMYVSLCPELDIVSQGNTVEEARVNLREAISLFYEHASESEITRRLHREIFITQLDVPIGNA